MSRVAALLLACVVGSRLGAGRGGRRSSRRLAFLVVDAPAITTSALPDGVKDEAYSVTLAASGEVSGWSLVSGELPEGLTLSAAGVISGTPVSVQLAENIVIRASGPGGVDEATFSLNIAAPDPTPAGHHLLGTFRFASNYASGDTSADLTAQSAQVAVNDYGYNPVTGEYIKFTFASGNLVSFSRHQLGSSAAAISSGTTWNSYRAD